MTNERLKKQMQFIAEIDKLKSILRQTALANRSRQENVAEHSWHIAVMALLLSEYSNVGSIDTNKVVKMLLIHDLVEIYAGDTFLYAEYLPEEKFEEERKACENLFNILPSDQAEDMISTWEEFEAEQTPEARFAKTIDALQPILLGYENQGWSWHQHSINKEQILKHKEHMKQGSLDLWKYTKNLLDEAEDKGFVPTE